MAVIISLSAIGLFTVYYRLKNWTLTLSAAVKTETLVLCHTLAKHR